MATIDLRKADRTHPASGKMRETNGLSSKETRAQITQRQYRAYRLAEQRQRIVEEVQDVDFSE